MTHRPRTTLVTGGAGFIGCNYLHIALDGDPALKIVNIDSLTYAGHPASQRRVAELDPTKVYYAHVLSDGDNLGEALMMRTRDLQWDKPERGNLPVGWSFAPERATRRFALSISKVEKSYGSSSCPGVDTHRRQHMRSTAANSW